MSLWYEMTLPIDSRDVDGKGVCKASALLGHLQEAVTQAAEHGGFSREVITREHGAFWMLTRVWYRLERPLRWEEELTIRTWHRGGRAATMYRDYDLLVDGEPVHFRSGKAKELMALCVYRDGRPVSIHEIVENLWGENADGTGYRRTIKELADTLRDYGAEEMFLRSRGSLRVRMDLADSDFQAFMSGDEDAICQFQGVFMQQYSWAEPMVCTLQEKKELMLARMGKHRM